MNQLESITTAEYLDSNDSAETITNLLLQNSVSLVKNRTAKQIKSFVRLLEEVRVARYLDKVTLMIGNNLISHLRVMPYDIYRAKRKDYRSKLRDFLNHLEADKIKKKTFVMLLIVFRSYFRNFEKVKNRFLK